MDSTVTRLVAMRRTGRQTVASPHEPRPGNTVRTGAQGVERLGTSRKSTQLPQVCALAVPHRSAPGTAPPTTRGVIPPAERTMQAVGVSVVGGRPPEPEACGVRGHNYRLRS